MRSVKEWIGKTDNAPIPQRVRLRILDRYIGICAECRRPLRSGHTEFDHIISLINGGGHREFNLQPLCNIPCHKEKTRQDVAVKSKNYARRAKHVGIRKAKHPISGWRKFDGTPVRNPKAARR